MSGGDNSRLLTLAAVLALGGGVVAIIASRVEHEGDDEESIAAEADADADSARAGKAGKGKKGKGKKKRSKRLDTLGYLGGTEVKEKDRHKSGVILRGEGRPDDHTYSVWTALAWHTIANPKQRDRLKRRVHLIDDTGKVVHVWHAGKPGAKTAKGEGKSGRGWANMDVGDDGGLVVVEDGASLVRLDWDSNVVWRTTGRFHHEAEIVGDRVWAARAEFQPVEGPDGPLNVWSGDFVEMDYATGEVLRTIKTWDALRTVEGFDDKVRSEIRRLDTRGDRSDWNRKFNDEPVYDTLHLNSLQVLTEDMPRPEGWDAGDVLTCFRNAEMLALFDKDDFSIKWSFSGHGLDRPHDPSLIEGGRVLLFDNGMMRGWSRVIEIDIAERRIAWEYKADPPTAMYSRSRGLAQRLDNGNTLVVESANGRVFEVTPEKNVAWDYFSTVRYREAVKDKNGKKDKKGKQGKKAKDAKKPKKGKMMRAALRMIRLEGAALDAIRNNVATKPLNPGKPKRAG